jgi:hypothetical protein
MPASSVANWVIEPAQPFGAYLIRTAGRGLWNAAKRLLFVANPSRQIATNYRRQVLS